MDFLNPITNETKDNIWITNFDFPTGNKYASSSLLFSFVCLCVFLRIGKFIFWCTFTTANGVMECKSTSLMQVTHSGKMLSLLQSTIFCFCMYSISRCSTFAVYSRVTADAAAAAECDSIYIIAICVVSIVVTITVIVCQLDVYFMRYICIFHTKLLLFLRSRSKISRFFTLFWVYVFASRVYYTLACECFTAKFSVYSFKTYLKDTNRWDIEKRQSCYFLFRWKVFEFSFLFLCWSFGSFVRLLALAWKQFPIRCMMG